MHSRHRHLNLSSLLPLGPVALLAIWVIIRSL